MSLRQWLIKDAGLSEKRVLGHLKILDEEEVDTLAHLRVFTSLSRFDERFRPLTAALIRKALGTDHNSTDQRGSCHAQIVHWHLRKCAGTTIRNLMWRHPWYTEARAAES